MRHLMQVVPPGGKVLDPFAGGGATLVAAHQMELNAVGIEKTEANYKTAVARIAELLPHPPRSSPAGWPPPHRRTPAVPLPGGVVFLTYSTKTPHFWRRDTFRAQSAQLQERLIADDAEKNGAAAGAAETLPRPAGCGRRSLDRGRGRGSPRRVRALLRGGAHCASAANSLLWMPPKPPLLMTSRTSPGWTWLTTCATMLSTSAPR